MDAQVACRLSPADVRQFRALEELNARLRRENEELENDSRLWHEAEADRVRRIGNVQWWQELDSREGEKLAIDEQLSALIHVIVALRWELDTLCQAIEWHRAGALTNDGLWHYHEKARALLEATEEPASTNAPPR